MTIKSHLQKIGIDKAIAYTVLSRGFQAMGSNVSMLLITRFLTQVEQGYYYTFGSILAMQIFFELGLNGIIVQYVAHEAAHVKSFDVAGDEVIFASYAGTEVKIDNEEFLILSEDEVLAVID